jgi:FixJ family two-component response regulator
MTHEAVVHVIDDDDAARDSLAFLLDTAGFCVRTYESAAVFLGELARVEPGCIISDVRMPEITGLELLRRLREQKIDWPVIIMTGQGDVTLAVESVKAFYRKALPSRGITRRRQIGSDGFQRRARGGKGRGAGAFGGALPN